jgi:hypothetical protein
LTVPAEELILTQNFSVPGDNFMRIDEDTAGEEINPRRDQGEDFDITPTGWSWGGYANNGGVNRVELDENFRAPGVYRDELDENFRAPGVYRDELIFKNNPNNNYA